jgi:hypothetical protein
MPDAPDVNATVREIEAIVDAQPEAAPLVQLLMKLYGAGLARVVEMIREDGQAEILERLAGDKLVASLFLLHDLHPVDPETRLRQALQRLERRFEAQRILLDGVREGVALVRVEHNGGGAPSPALAEMIEQVALEAAPDLDGIEIEGVPAAAVLVQIAPARSAG